MITEEDILKIIDDSTIRNSDSQLPITVCKKIIAKKIVELIKGDKDATNR